MITEDELIERKEDGSIDNEDIRDLMNEFDVPPIDLADICDCSYSTFKIYLSDSNSTQMPKKHQDTIINFFLDKFGYEEPVEEEQEEEPAEPDTGSSEEKDSTECTSDAENSTARNIDAENSTDKEESEQKPGRKVASVNNSLVAERVIFRPKDGLGEALAVAADIAEGNEARVQVRDGDRLITINVE